MIIKNPGDRFGIRRRTITHSGPARELTLLATLAHSGAFGKADPTEVPPQQQFWATIKVPAAIVPTNWDITDLALGSIPEAFQPGTEIDINIAIGPKRSGQESASSWWPRRYADDWDDNAYKIANVSASIPSDGATYY